MWAGALRLDKTSPLLGEFITAWQNPKYTPIVDQIVRLLMQNLDQEGVYCLPYNITGLMHKTDAAAGLKAFTAPVDKGGMGATMDEVVRVAFPFILRQCQNTAVVKTDKVSHNEFQILQLVELVFNLFPHMAGISSNQNVYPHVDFGTVSQNQALERMLTEVRRDAQSVAALADARSSQKAKLVKSAEATVEDGVVNVPK